MPEVDFHTGIETLVEEVPNLEKPRIIAVHSPGKDHGKSELIKAVSFV